MPNAGTNIAESPAIQAVPTNSSEASQATRSNPSEAFRCDDDPYNHGSEDHDEHHFGGHDDHVRHYNDKHYWVGAGWWLWGSCGAGCEPRSDLCVGE